LDYPFKYETHAHCHPASACAKTTPEEVVEHYAQAGYSGLFLTDHFNGNTDIDRNLPWAERIRQFVDCFHRAKRKGDEIGFQVFFGYEFTNLGADFLILNASEKFLYDHPDMNEWELTDFFDRAHADGAFIVHAHPCRESAWILDPARRYPDHVDAVEVFNTGMPPEINSRAEVYARECDLPRFSGSDYHFTHRPSNAGIAFREKPATAEELIRLVKAGEYRLLGLDDMTT